MHHSSDMCVHILHACQMRGVCTKMGVCTWHLCTVHINVKLILILIYLESRTSRRSVEVFAGNGR